MKSNAHKSPLATIRLLWSAGGVAAMFFAAAAWWHWLGGPTLAQRSDLQRRIRAIEEKRASLHVIHAACAAAREEAEHWRQVSREMDTRTAAHGAETAFLNWVDERAEPLGLTIRDYRPANRQRHGAFDCRSLFLSSYGTYEAICRFLDELRSCPRMCRVTNFELSPRHAVDDDYSLTLQVMLFADSTPAAKGS
jgi:hypothetical protein